MGKVEQIKSVRMIDRVSLDEVAYLAESLTQDVELFNKVNDVFQNSGYEGLDWKSFEDFVDAATSTVDRIVVVDEELEIE